MFRTHLLNLHQLEARWSTDSTQLRINVTRYKRGNRIPVEAVHVSDEGGPAIEEPTKMMDFRRQIGTNL